MTETNIERVGKLFAIDTAEHEMTILLDQGLHRHVRFMRPKPGSSSYWYELITVPNALIFRGDYESLVFSRVEDMFGFFRSNPDRLTMRISPDYWAEKLTSDRDGVKHFSQDRFEQIVKELTVEAIRYGNAPRGIGKAVRERILNDEDIHFEDGARRALNDFEHGAKKKIECLRCGQTIEIDDDDIAPIAPIAWRRRHDGHPQTKQHVEGFRFTDTWEYDFKDFDHGYLWACHAIVAGIARYDEAKAKQAATAGGVKTQTCHSIACDVCDYELDEDDDGIVHFSTPEAALDYARDAGWWATTSAVLCNGVNDIEHSAKAAEIADQIARTDADGQPTAAFLTWCEKTGFELDDEPPSAATMPGQTEIATEA